jgi:hypothetical protein
MLQILHFHLEFEEGGVKFIKTLQL